MKNARTTPSALTPLPRKAQETAIVHHARADLTATALEENLEESARKRALMDRFIRENLKHGVDYAKPFRSAGKETLLKPGSEKVCVLLNLMPVFRGDEETLSHLPASIRNSTITFLCELVNRSTGVKIAEGRGSASLTESNIKGNLNSAIKMAEKRAQMDATLRVAALSDRFTQDMEDSASRSKLSAPNDLPQLEKEEAITSDQNAILCRFWDELVDWGVIETRKSDIIQKMTLKKLYGVTSLSALTQNQAQDFTKRIVERIIKAKNARMNARKTYSV